VAINDGDVPYVPLDVPVPFEGGRVMNDLGCFGQSDCILAVPNAAMDLDCVIDRPWLRTYPCCEFCGRSLERFVLVKHRAMNSSGVVCLNMTIG